MFFNFHWRTGAHRIAWSAMLVVASLLGGCGGGSDAGPAMAQEGRALAPMSGFNPGVPSVPAGFSVTYGVRAFHFAWQPSAGATYYQLSEDPDGLGPLPYAALAGKMGPSGFIHQLEALHLRLNARYILRACNGQGCSAASAPLVPDLARAIGYFKSAAPSAEGYFGFAAALSADGRVLAVGAPGEAAGAPYTGAVYMYERTGGAWDFKARLAAAHPDRMDYFGYSVAMSADGAVVVVGAWGESSAARGIDGDQSDNSSDNAGAAYVFRRRAGEPAAWGPEAYIKASNPQVVRSFGASVAISSDGATVAVGAPSESSGSAGVDGDQNDTSQPSAGAVYMFSHSGGMWAQQAYIKASNARADSKFGGAVALSGDGSTLAVGARLESSAASGVNGNQADTSAPAAGAVYVFAMGKSGWAQQAYIKASNAGADDWFGEAVALSADGNTLAAGARFEDSRAKGINGDGANEAAYNAGAAYVFTRAGGNWSQQAYVKATNTDAGDNFGASVALSADGNLLAVGDPAEQGVSTGINGDQTNGPGSGGAVHVYARSFLGWSPKSYLKAPQLGPGDSFGQGLALSADGKTLAVGVIYEDGAGTGLAGDMLDDSLSNAGAVFLY